MRIFVLVSGYPLFPGRAPVYGLPYFATSSARKAVDEAYPRGAVVTELRHGDDPATCDTEHLRTVLSNGQTITVIYGDGRHVMAIPMEAEE